MWFRGVRGERHLMGVLAAAAWLLSAAQSRAEEPGWVIVLHDGSAFEAVSSPVREGRLWIIRSTDGRVYSVRESLVVAIERRLPAVVRPAPPEPVAAPSGPPRSYSNEDLRYWKLTEKQWEAKGEYAGKVGEERAARPRMPADLYLDRSGRGEEYWRPRFRSAKAEVEAVQAERGRLQAEYDRLIRLFGEPVDAPYSVYAGFPYAYDGPVAYMIGLRLRLAELDTTLTWQQNRLRELEDDARHAGALPGWMR